MLTEILAATRRRIELLPPVEVFIERAAVMPSARDFAGALTGDALAVIAEVKRRSPSRGDLAPDLDPAEQARRYASGGASAISVLTEPDFFAGSNADLVAVRAAVDLPVIRKDFTLDPRQIWEARSIGADAVLLIVAALTDAELQLLLATAGEAGVAALVEVHTADEADRAMGAGATIVGVNNRNLDSFDVDLATAESIAPRIGSVPMKVAESGIHTASDAARMLEAGFDAVLVGESLVRSADPAESIRLLRQAK